jgi:hypothetical protein
VLVNNPGGRQRVRGKRGLADLWTKQAGSAT